MTGKEGRTLAIINSYILPDRQGYLEKKSDGGVDVLWMEDLNTHHPMWNEAAEVSIGPLRAAGVWGKMVCEVPPTIYIYWTLKLNIYTYI